MRNHTLLFAEQSHTVANATGTVCAVPVRSITCPMESLAWQIPPFLSIPKGLQRPEIRGEMSCQAVQWVLQHSKSKGSARLVLISIAEHADDQGGGSWPSVATIAREAMVSRAAVFASLKKLVDAKELRLLRHGGGRHQETNRYLLPQVSPQQELLLPRVQSLDGSKLRATRVQSLDPNHHEPPKKEKAAQPLRVLPPNSVLRSEAEQRRIVEARDKRQLNEAIARAAAHIGAQPKSATGADMANTKTGYMDFVALRDQKRLPTGMTWSTWQRMTIEEQLRELARVDAESKKAATA